MVTAAKVLAKVIVQSGLGSDIGLAARVQVVVGLGQEPGYK